MLGRLLVCVLAALFPLAAHTAVPAPRPLHQMIDGRGGRYDADKFNWLGSPEERNSVTFVRGDARDVSTD